MSDVILAGIPFEYTAPLHGWEWAHVERFEGGDFRAVALAEQRVGQAGMSYGSMQGDAPIACYVGDCYVSKWRGLSDADRMAADAMIVGDKRNGPVWVLFREVPRG